MNKRMMILLLALVFCMSVSDVALAHSSSVSLRGEDSIGWNADYSEHMNKTSTSLLEVDYYIDKLGGNWVEKAYDIIDKGVQKWGTQFVFTETSSRSCPYKFEVSKKIDDADVYGYTRTNSKDSQGHATSWTIQLSYKYLTNGSNKVTPRIVAHEIGHAIGLKHLLKSSNKDKIMYIYAGDDGTTNAATTRDKLGARVVTGIHSSHTLTKYTYHDRASNTQTSHKKSCTTCDGYIIEDCTYRNNRCIYCGTYQKAVAR